MQEARRVPVVSVAWELLVALVALEVLEVLEEE